MSVSDEEDVTTSMKNTFKSFNLKDKNKSIVTKIRGNGNIILDSNEVILKSISSFPTFKINIDLPQSGSYYYEIQIFTSRLMQLGWSDDDMIIKSSSNGVGDDNHSWGYDGNRKCSWNNGRQTYEGAKLWNINDYIGFGLDYDKKICEFFINGKSMGIAFKNMNINGNIYPTLTLSTMNTIKILSIDKIKYYNKQIKDKYKTVIDISNYINNNIKNDIIQFCLAMDFCFAMDLLPLVKEDIDDYLLFNDDGWIIWKIDGSLLKKYISPEFNIFGIKFVIECYPNGYYEEGKTDIDVKCIGISAPTKVMYSMVCDEANTQLDESKEIQENQKFIEMERVFNYDVWNEQDVIFIEFKIWQIFERNDALQLVTWRLNSDEFEATTVSNEFAMNGIHWIMDINANSIGLRLKKSFIGSSSIKIYRKIECENINDECIIMYDVGSDNIDSSVVHGKQWENNECLEIKCHIQLLSVEYKNQTISLEPKINEQTQREIENLKQELLVLKNSSYICSKIITENEMQDISNNDEKQLDYFQQEEYDTLFCNHEQILNEWNTNTMKLKKFASPIEDDEKKHDYDNDKVGKALNSLILLQENTVCNEIINQQKDRLNKVASENYLLQLLKIQNTLIIQQDKLQQESSIMNQQLNEITEEYRLMQNKRTKMQKSVEEQMNTLNQTIESENELLLIQKKIKLNTYQRNERIQQIESLSEKCTALVDKYNDFMQINQTVIDKSSSYFKSKWIEFESKWFDWTTNDIIGWFKYKTQSMNTIKVEWKQIKDELEKQNICGQLLSDFTENSLYMIGMHDFKIRNYISKCIAVLKAKYALKQNDDNMDEIPSEFICPITKQIMKDPVIAFDAHTYERTAIEKYLTMHQKSPITNAKAFTSTVFPNIPLKQRIQSYQHAINTQNDNYNEENEGNDTIYID